MPNWVLLVLAFGVWTSLLVCGFLLIRGVRGVVNGVEQLAESARSPDLARLEAELGGLKAQVEGLPSIWEEYAEKAGRARERARWYARRAAERAGEGDDGELEDLPIEHGGGSDEGRMQPLPTYVAPPPQPQLAHIRAGWQRKLMG